ncbi:hypothetical protein ACFB49_38250 [Sphingomonas sp. DBB INV C78]|uniref:hypothetical protein n=1 Tax=Sphingomonas sp. DBB INV C78 TaxID=3349434 RepID=UPI0036D35096
MLRPRTRADRRLSLVGLLLTSFLVSPVLAQDAAPAPAPPREDVTRELQELRAMRQDLQRQMGEFDSRIRTLESGLGATSPSGAVPPAGGPVNVAPVPAVSATREAPSKAPDISGEDVEIAGQEVPTPVKGQSSVYEPGRGFVLVRDDEGELGVGLYTYARYLNQMDLNKSYVDAFGRTQSIDRRNDIEFQKVSMNMKGWLFDPKFRYYLFFWTNNPAQGDGAQVVIGGWVAYEFSKWLNVTVGIVPLPTTHSTNWSFPNWLRNDNRVMADEFFRGSYTQGIEATGEILPGLRYRASLANNLSALGVSAKELDSDLNTQSIALWWMPTTHEYGPSFGIGDYEYHKQLATLFSVHFTHSREDAQGQPDVDVFDNSQIRLSDGTRLFSPDPFNVGVNIEKATYKMLALNGGFKYKGWHLEGEYYFRWVDNFKASGPLPVDKLYDNGFTIQGSTMVVRDVLQAYGTASKIYGEYGDPTEFSLGLNWFPFRRKEVRLNTQLLFLNDSPVGGTALPQTVGGDGVVFSTDLIIAF